MKETTLRHFADGAVTVGVAAGATTAASKWIPWVNENHIVIGLIMSAFFGTIGSIFYIMTYFKAKKADVNSKEIQALKEQLKGLSDRKRDN